jgi:hypothetical protein
MLREVNEVVSLMLLLQFLFVETGALRLLDHN